MYDIFLDQAWTSLNLHSWLRKNTADHPLTLLSRAEPEAVGPESRGRPPLY